MSCGLESLKSDKETANTKRDTSTTTTINDFSIGMRKSSKIGTMRIVIIRSVMNDLTAESR
jgi:hypothetical protein